MTRTTRFLLPAALILALAGCNQPEENAPGTAAPVPTDSVDTDPTPQTGTGGPQLTADPDATVNSAPAAGEGQQPQ